MPEQLTTFDQIITQNEEMLECLQIARMAAMADVTVLVLGENGTGKNLIAQALHRASPRAGGPYVPVNCSALAETLLESELFGHVRGAFTNAERDRRGKFELADHGTLFLDEIGDMSQSAQAKILRAVEEHEFEPIGSERTVRSDVRIVAATNRDLAEYVRQERFREDLYYRLNEVVLRVPPLRERREDIPVLVDHFVKSANRKFGKAIRGASNVTLNYLLRYDWPGNVRELRNVINFGVMMAQRDVIWIEDLAWKIEGGRLEPDMGREDDDLSLDGVERRHVRRVLLITSGNKKRACELLGISRPTLNRMLRRWAGSGAEPADVDGAADTGEEAEADAAEGGDGAPPPTPGSAATA
jgi:transcriptional regulator with PAS, ATPase and Fis domain